MGVWGGRKLGRKISPRRGGRAGEKGRDFAVVSRLIGRGNDVSEARGLADKLLLLPFLRVCVRVFVRGWVWVCRGRSRLSTGKIFSISLWQVQVKEELMSILSDP